MKIFLLAVAIVSFTLTSAWFIGNALTGQMQEISTAIQGVAK